MKEIIDYYLNKLLNSEPTPDLKIILEKLISMLRFYGYPVIELADIIAIEIMLDYILSSPTLIKSHKGFIKESVSVINDILGDMLYVKVEPEIIMLEVEFRKNICISSKRCDDMLSEKVRDLILNEY